MHPRPDHLVASVQRALDAIEAGLREPISVEHLARESGMSFWYFQRVFGALVGEPVASYLRRRRLTAAARELRLGHRPIVEIALEFQFESHETFTRAFRATFQVAPQAYRRNPRPLRRSRARIQAMDLRHFGRIDPKPLILELPELHLAGLSTRYFGVTADSPNDTEVIPALWQRFLARRHELPTAPNARRMGAWDFPPEQPAGGADEFVALAALEIAADTPVPAGMVHWRAGSGRYARFTHRGSDRRIRDTISFIYAAWLPRSGHERGSGFDFMHFDDRFKGNDDTSEIDYYLPLAR